MEKRMGRRDREVEKWKHIFFIGELSQQRWMRLAGFAILSHQPQRPTFNNAGNEIKYNQV